MAVAAAPKITLKLLVDMKGQKVLFAEAGKDFIDFLFSVLSLPVGTIIRLLTKKGMVGSLGNLYESIENLNENYIQPNQKKDTLLKPTTTLSIAHQVPLLFSADESPMTPPPPMTVPTAFYKCGCNIFSSCNGSYCNNCGRTRSTQVTYYVPGQASAPVKAGSAVGAADKGGFVKEVVTYMVMDDLVVTPMSTISCITLLNKFQVKEVGALEEKVVQVGIDEGMKILRYSFSSKTVLTSAFLRKVVGS